MNVCVCFHGEAIANVEMDVNVRFPSLDVDPNIYSTIAGNSKIHHTEPI